MNNTEYLPEKQSLLLGKDASLKGVKYGNLCWASGSFLVYWNCSEAAYPLPKGSITPSDRDEEHGGVEQQQQKGRINFNH
jgi:hypothetical protein